MLQRPLFDALRAQGVDEGYVALITALYKWQVATANGSKEFNIERGVRQGDVLSTLLFNAGIESAMRVWKQSWGEWLETRSGCRPPH